MGKVGFKCYRWFVMKELKSSVIMYVVLLYIIYLFRELTTWFFWGYSLCSSAMLAFQGILQGSSAIFWNKCLVTLISCIFFIVGNLFSAATSSYTGPVANSFRASILPRRCGKKWKQCNSAVCSYLSFPGTRK